MLSHDAAWMSSSCSTPTFPRESLGIRIGAYQFMGDCPHFFWYNIGKWTNTFRKHIVSIP